MFSLDETTQVVCTNANPRTELHGDERVRAIDLSFCITGENTLLNRIADGLREHHYYNKDLKAGQEPLPGVLIPLPNLRFPRLPLSYPFAKGEKWRGYRWIWDWGTEGEHVDFTDAVLSNLHYDLMEGGSCKIYFTVQYNGPELTDNALHGELSGLPCLSECYIKLIAPGEIVPAKKGYRAGKPDTPPATDGGGDLLSQDEDDDGSGDGDDDEESSEDAGGGTGPKTPEEALTAAAGGGAANTGGVWPFKDAA